MSVVVWGLFVGFTVFAIMKYVTKYKIKYYVVFFCFLTPCVSLFPLFLIYCLVAAIYANKDVYIFCRRRFVPGGGVLSAGVLCISAARDRCV